MLMHTHHRRQCYVAGPRKTNWLIFMGFRGPQALRDSLQPLASERRKRLQAGCIARYGRCDFQMPILGAGLIGTVACPSKVQPVFGESHTAASKHTVIRVEKTRGVVKACLQLTAVTATKQMASAHAMLRTRAKVSAGSRLRSHANTAANKRNTEKKSPNALKKSQYVRVNPCASKWTERINARTASALHSGLFWRNPNVCPAAKSSRSTEAIR